MCYIVLYDFLATVKAAPHECVIRTDLPMERFAHMKYKTEFFQPSWNTVGGAKILL